MAPAQVSDYELLTEHLGYSPVSLIDDIINTVNVLADRALDSVERFLLTLPPQKLGFTSKDKSSSLPPDEAAKLEIENGTHQLETVLNSSIDKNFDIFELYIMQNILTITAKDRPFVRLSHYQGLDFQGIGEDREDDGMDRPTRESVEELWRKLRASQKLHVALEQERRRNDELLGSLRRLLGDDAANEEQDKTDASGAQPSPLAFLKDRGGLEQGAADKPLTTTTEFALSQLQALRSLSKSLRTLLPDLQPEFMDVDEETQDGGRKSFRRQRVEYVEGASRKYLESVGGLEMGPQGGVRDGEWQGEGRGLGKDEVEGLERVAAMLEDGNEKGKGDEGQ